MLSSSAATCGDQSVGAVLTTAPVPAEGADAHCVQSLIAIDSGPNEGANTLLEFSGGPGQPQLAVGENIRITRVVDPTGTTTYSFYDYERKLAVDRDGRRVRGGGRRGRQVARTARARRHRRCVRGVGRVHVACAARRRRRDPCGAGRVGHHPVCGDLSRARCQSAHECGTPRHVDSASACRGVILGRNRIGPSDRFIPGREQRGRDLPRQRVDHRAAAGRLHRRLARRAQRRHRHPGVDGVRAGSSRRRQLTQGHLRGRHAGGPRPHRQHCLHAGARVRR